MFSELPPFPTLTPNSHLWDYAAGNLVLHESGGRSIALDGEPVFRGKYEDRSALAALDDSLFDYWKEWVGVSKPSE